ncbi:MAG: hypothetical protein U5O39_09610 [Gammaproteobacteria bacterium]|nr:hypothetical protein [Gammaproteobacteria bacterium]
MKLTNIAKGIALAASLTAAGSAMAASDGSLGADSTGTSDISLEIVDRVQISNMKDITIPAYSGTGDLSPDTTFCVYRNGGDDYKVTLTTDTTGFQLESGGTGDAVPFTAKVDDDLDATDGEAVTDANPSSALSGSVSVTCGGSDNASIALNMTEADLQAASSGNDYQSTMTVFVEPI